MWMWKWISLLAVFLFLLLATRWVTVSALGLVNPPLPGQPHTDLFTYTGIPNMQDLNPVNVKAKLQGHSVRYALVTMPGCSTGSIPQDMGRVEAEAQSKLHFALARNDASPDFTIRINCGSEQIRLCGSVTTFCLGRGFPYNADVELSDILSTYTAESQLAIPLHEVVGHALATWNEQYCLGTEGSGSICSGLAQFTPAPNWHDFMNTGPESRHGIESIEIDRWERTMYPIRVECQSQGYDSCTGRWFQADGWSWDPGTGAWYNPLGIAEWSSCNSDRVRFNLAITPGFWAPQGSGFFLPSRGFWSFVPAC